MNSISMLLSNDFDILYPIPNKRHKDFFSFLNFVLFYFKYETPKLHTPDPSY